MRVLISGCSFTHWPEHPGSPNNVCWPTPLQQINPEFWITNLAEPGAGNLYIANSVVRHVLEHPGKTDHVLIMWSGVSRIDMLTDISEPSWHALFDRYGFYRRVESCPNTLGYVFSGGFLGPWTLNTDVTDLFKPIYRVSSNLSLAHNNLIEIVKTQNFLKAKGIPYHFMSYVNYWHDREHCSPNGDFGVLKYAELAPLIGDIDWSRWIFSDAQRNGIYEMARAANDYNGDQFHPGAETNRVWARLVSQAMSGSGSAPDR